MPSTLFQYYFKRDDTQRALAGTRRTRKVITDPVQDDGQPVLFQTTLTHHSFRINFKNPCFINMLPPELLMEILSYLPSVSNLKVRVHADPSKLSDSGANDSEEVEDDDDSNPGWYRMGLAQCCNGYGNCLAELRFRNGCARFCSSQPWNFLDVLRVCKRWHTISYANPQFWTNIAIQNFDTVVRSLVLSGSLPLTIISSNSTREEKRQWPSLEALELALDQLSRVRVLDMFFISFNHVQWEFWTEPVISRLRRLPATQLNSLRLKLLRSHSDRLVRIRTETWVEQSFPALRTLELSAAKIYAPCALLVQSLTELSLVDCEAPWKSAADFLHTFAGLSQLRSLSITKTENPKDFDDERLNVPRNLSLPIPMDHLRFIELQGSFRFVNRVLSAFVFPLDSTTLKLQYQHDDFGVSFGADPDDALAKTLHLFTSYALAIPTGTYFNEVNLDFDLDERFIEITLSQPDPSGVSVQLKHTWTEANDRHAGDILNFVRQTSTPLFSSKRTASLIILLTGRFDEIAESSPTFTPDACYDWIAGLSALRLIRLSSQAIPTFIAWMVRRLNTAAGLLPSGDEEESESKEDAREPGSERLWHRRRYPWMSEPKPKPKIEPKLLFPDLRRLILNECNLGETINEDKDSSPEDILFSHLWLYLHAQQPELVLIDTELTHRMLHELRRKLYPARLDERSVYPVDDNPYIRVSHAWRDSGEELDVYTQSGRSKTVKSPPWSVLGDAGHGHIENDEGNGEVSAGKEDDDM
ncbi:hypothetical protein PENSPDRAFT_757275 [Peniophora sp. CONT]|nr:hypothetical protein PENSPDRAFT_757275 [Peniophora sp. CONT]